MNLTPKRPEIDHRTMKLVVGVIALCLPVLTSFLARPDRIASISAAYYEERGAQSVFIGFLFAIASFLCAYNGRCRTEMIMSRVAAVSALLIVLFPCGCVPPHGELVPGAHYAAAAVMFLVLTYFCAVFCFRAIAKRHVRATVRAGIYLVCGITILLAISVLALNQLLSGIFSSKFDRFVFYGESAGLVAFGMSWLTASHVLPAITTRSERFSPLS